MKFNIGDEVVTVKQEPGKTYLNWTMPLGTRGVVSAVYETSLNIDFDYALLPNQYLRQTDYGEIELAAIVNSPLWEALE